MVVEHDLMKKIIDLEKRILLLEEKIAKLAHDDNQELMDELYEKSKNLVIRFQKASAVFLQKKLLIDFPRAKLLIKLLEKRGVVSKLNDDNSREILTSE